MIGICANALSDHTAPAFVPSRLPIGYACIGWSGRDEGWRRINENALASMKGVHSLMATDDMGCSAVDLMRDVNHVTFGGLDAQNQG